MRVDDPRAGALENACVGADFRFADRRLVPRYQPRWNVEGFGVFVQTKRLGPLVGGLGDDPFLGVGVRNRVFLAEGVEALAALDAQGGF